MQEGLDLYTGVYLLAGAFQTSRDIFDNPIWQNVVEFRLFFLIYGKAIFKEDGHTQGGVKLERGQWLRSYRNLQIDLEYVENRSVKKYSLSRIHRAVDNLIKSERIKVEDTGLGTLFTVINYSKYQGLENYKQHNENAERTQREREENGNGTEREQGWNNNNNDNKGNKENKEPKSENKFSDDSPPVILSRHLFQWVKKNEPKAKEPNFQTWAVHMDRLIRIDSRTEDEIRQVIDKCQKDTFWSSNILSTDKLRQKFPSLALKFGVSKHDEGDLENTRKMLQQFR